VLEGQEIPTASTHPQNIGKTPAFTPLNPIFSNTKRNKQIGLWGEPVKKRPESSIRDLGGYWCRRKTALQLDLKINIKVMTHQISPSLKD
jgi:hypothetical protein